MSEEEDWISFELFGMGFSETGLTRKLSYLTLAVSVLVGSYLRIEMGYLDKLVSLDPYEMYHLSRHWLEHWGPATVDKLLFPGPGGYLSGVGYPPLTHALPAIFTKFLNLFGLSVSLKSVVIIFPVLIGAFLPIVYWFLGKELYNEKVGIVAALLTFVFPQFITIGVAGKYDTNIYIALFYPLILGLFVKSFNVGDVRSKVRWGLGGGVALGVFGLFWAGYSSIFAMIAFSIVLYTAVATWIDKIEKEDTYSLLGILVSYPILLFFHSLNSLQGVLLVAPLVFLPYISSRIPEWSTNLSFVEDGVSFRKKLMALVAVVVFAGAYLVYTGTIPLNIRGVGMVKKVTAVQHTISELQPTYGRYINNPNQAITTPLTQSFGAFGTIAIPVLFLPLLYILYKLKRSFNPGGFFEFVFVGFTFVMHFLAARFLPLYVYFVTPAIAAEILWVVEFDYLGGLNKVRESMEKTYVKLTSWDKFKSLVVFLVVFWLLLTSMPVSGLLSGNPRVGKIGAVVHQESSGAWISTFNYLDQNESITTDDYVLSWWDYGFAMKVLGNVSVFTDNTQFNAEEAAKFYTLQNTSESREYITSHMREERGEDVDYVIGNKYIGFSGKWHAMVTVSTGLMEDHPNLADNKLEEGETQWMWTSQTGVGEKVRNSTYYKLSFYNSLAYGVGDEPYPGYKIVYQSPQWYVSTNQGLAITTAKNIQKVLTRGSANIPVLLGRNVVRMNISLGNLASFGSGPAITLYELTNTTS